MHGWTGTAAETFKLHYGSTGSVPSQLNDNTGEGDLPLTPNRKEHYDQTRKMPRHKRQGIHIQGTSSRCLVPSMWRMDFMRRHEPVPEQHKP